MDSEAEARAIQAQLYYQQGLDRVRDTPEPENQKFANGSRVHIKVIEEPWMSHFEDDCDATVVYTYDHMFGGGDVKSYCLDIDGVGRVSWYEEHQLEQI